VNDTGEAHKGIHEHSASIVVQGIYGEGFRKRVVLHISYRHSSLVDWYEKSLNYTLYGFDKDRRERLEKASELDLLQVVNNLAENHSEFLKLRKIQTTG